MANQAVYRNDNISEILFHIELADMKHFKLFKSKEFFVRGNPWYLVFEKISNGDNDYLIVLLRSSFRHKSNKSIIIAESEINLLGWKSNSIPICQNLQPKLFTSRTIQWRARPFISWNQLMNPENGYVMDDKCRFEIRIKATPLLDVTTGDCVKIEMINSCGNCSQQKFRMKINKFHEFTGIGSHEIVFKDLSFHVGAYRSANKLCFDIQKYGFNGCSVSLTLKLISNDANIKPIEQKIMEQFGGVDFRCTKLHQLATWKELTDPAKKFIENNSFVIEVDLKIETDESKAKKCRTCSDGNGAVFLECPICFENLKSVPVSSFPCGHLYCTECAKGALQKEGKCPECRMNATNDSLRPCYLPTV